MKSVIFIAMLVIGFAACETPQQTTGSSDGTSGTDATTQPTTSGSAGTATSTDTVGRGTTGGMSRDTSTTKRDSLPK